MDSTSETKEGWNGPTKESVLCSLHFEADCFHTDGRFYYEPLGIGQARRRLKPDSISEAREKPRWHRGGLLWKSVNKPGYAWSYNRTTYPKAHSVSLRKISKLILCPTVCKDVAHLSPSHQTSYLEAFYSAIIHFAPKNTAFSYLGMESKFTNKILPDLFTWNQCIITHKQYRIGQTDRQTHAYVHCYGCRVYYNCCTTLQWKITEESKLVLKMADRGTT